MASGSGKPRRLQCRTTDVKTPGLPASAPKIHPSEARFYELDILRGLAAMVVVIFHYKHFLIDSDYHFDYDHMPFHAVLLPVYIYGQFFVELFFTLSGYVFFWLYSQMIANRQTGPSAFFVARFSRLYPLYFVTLILAALIQPVFHAIYGHDFIYTTNTVGNFLLNLFMVQQWVPASTQSFNGPAWSISVEAFLYLIFFGLCFFRLNRPVVLLLVLIGGILFKCLFPSNTNDFVRGIPSFFLGGLMYYAVLALRKAHMTAWRQGVCWGLAALLPILWLTAYLRGALLPVEQGRTLPDLLLSVNSVLFILMPMTVLSFGLMQNHWQDMRWLRWLSRDRLHSLAWIGDISYSLYLIHFPVQLVIMLCLAHWSYAERLPVVSNPLSLIAFMSMTCGLAWLSFHYFEMPMRRFLRGWLTRYLARVPTIH